MHEITDFLFKADAIKVSDPKNPFWYTSGLIGPFYINTHYLAGGEAVATDILDVINSHATEKFCEQSIIDIHSKVMEAYAAHQVFRDTIEKAVELIEASIDVSEIDFVSGGERRDWFFHSIIAEKIGKPALFIRKDATVWAKEDAIAVKVDKIGRSKVLHVADLVTIASSYVKVWIPAIKQLGGTITHSLNIVDRLQGADKVMKENGIEHMPLARIDAEFFNTALRNGCITEAQHGLVVDYIRDPFMAMKKFLIENPEFLKVSLEAEDEKMAARSQLCVDADLYRLKA